MKKHLLSLFAIALTVGFTSAQSIDINHKGETTELSGGTYSSEVTTNDYFNISFDVYNNMGSSDDYIVTRKRINVPAGWQDDLCWGHSSDPFGNCYSYEAADPWVAPDAVALADAEYGWLKVGYYPQSGSATYRYYIGTSADPRQDSVDVQVSSVAGVIEVSKSVSLRVSPNPATSMVNIVANTGANANMKIVDVLGNVIKNESFDGKTTMNVSEFKNGVYFIMIEGPGMTTVNRKFVVRH